MKELETEIYPRSLAFEKVDRIDTRLFPFLTKYGYGPENARIFAEGIVELANLIVTTHTETLVLMDKSARPVAQLLKAYWREAYPAHKIPDIRFMNIGQEEKGKDENPDFLDLLTKAHEKSMNGKRIIVADERVFSGGSIRRAKKVIEKCFPQASKIIYTEVFKSCPSWYGMTDQLGVYDIENLPVDRKTKEFLWENDPDTHISKSLAGMMKRNARVRRRIGVHEKTQRQRMVNNLRRELSFFAKKVARLSNVIVVHNYVPQNRFGDRLSEYLNA